MPGVVITYNHTGIAGALWRTLVSQKEVKAETVGSEIAKSLRPEESVLGEVNEAWAGPDGAQWCSFTLYGGEHSGVGTMITNGLLRGVSLTHYRKSPIVPLELSLCKTPARPQCSVRHISRSPMNFERYKGLVLSGAIPSTMAEPQNAEKAISIIQGLPEDDQKLLMQAFDGMTEQLNRAVQASKDKETEAAQKLAEIEKSYQAQIKQAGVDSTILASELKGFQETLGSILSTRPELAKLVSCKELADNCLEGMSHQQMNGMNALVTCASKAIYMLQDQIASTSQHASGNKRARIETADEPSSTNNATTIIEPAAANGKLTLRDALQRTFER